ncbi:armadillo repeat protein deleted in velo-cardio-facial syndrome isoform X1 [Electrophorus electricus]|uniref:armadillo repeat protein deleted in velo-cardio-facial syndrome isoform X1 n=1 Tax=Electrophorus electricus TaxID=8005 RepID=UPI0015D0032E|nr:armadillo repeat protein deleted in velo-cardio-facial syndrome isoform X1 [Electrophorus electricus]
MACALIGKEEKREACQGWAVSASRDLDEGVFLKKVTDSPQALTQEQSLDDPLAVLSKRQTKEPTEEGAATENTLDTPSSDLSTLTSANGSLRNTEANTDESSGLGTEKSCSPDTELNPLTACSSHEEVVQPEECTAVATEIFQTVCTGSQDTESISPPVVSAEKVEETAGASPAQAAAEASTLHYPPGENVKEQPVQQSSHQSPRVALGGHGTMPHGFQYPPPYSNLPARNYLPENCYTLPLHRDFGRIGQSTSVCNGAAKRDEDGADLRSGIPAISHPMMGATLHLRPTLDLAVDDRLGPLLNPYLQDLYRMQTLIPQKRASMVSLDTIRKDPRWRDPNLREVIAMLSHPMDPVKSNAAAYLQHLCYENDKVKQDVRQLHGIPALVALLDHPKVEVYRKACGALRNISFGRDHFNKVAIKNSDGIPALLRLLRKSSDMEVRELVTGTLWNLSSHEPLKMVIINHGLQTLTDEIIIPHSGLRGDPNDPSRPGDPEWTTVFKNTSGCLRNVSSDGAEARQRMRECEGLVDALLHALYSAVTKRDMNNKSVENCVCILRNLSYHVHKEVPGAERFYGNPAAPPGKPRGCPKKKDEPHCFSGREEWFNHCRRHGASDKTYSTLDMPKRTLPTKGLELLYQPEVVRLYLSLLKLSHNQNTLEAAGGALQNLSAGHWAWSNYIRATVRKEKGLPILVELLHSDADKVVRAIAIALRNLAIDHKNKDLIGSYAMRDLVSNLPSGQQRPAKNLEGDTVVAILNTIHEIITDNLENARFLIQGQGIQKLVAINRTSQSVRETKAASHVLQTVWAYKDLRHTLSKGGWNKTHFKPAVSGVPKKQKNAKLGNDDITLPLMEKNQDAYCCADQSDRVGDGPCRMIERETFQGANDKRHFIRASRPAVGLVERTPQPLDSWV